MNWIAIVECADWVPEIEYSLRLLGSILGIDFGVCSYADVVDKTQDDKQFWCSYGRHAPPGMKRGVHCFNSRFFRTNGKWSCAPSHVDAWFESIPIPFVAGSSTEPLVRVVGDEDNCRRVETNLDLVASTFFFSTLCEEAETNRRDRFGRVPADACLAVRDGFIDRPIVHEYAEMLWNWITLVMPEATRREPWNGKGFAACVTHDIDHLRKYKWSPPLRVSAKHLIRDHNPMRAIREYREYLACLLQRKRDPFDTFDILNDLAAKRGFSSTYFWMGGGRDRLDGSYSLEDPNAQRILRQIQSRGHEIALHSSIQACADSATLVSEKRELERALGSAVSGVRQHFLMWDAKRSWDAREEAGFTYDASLGFPDVEGFRAGLCIPFHPFDTLARKELDLWEVPLTLMDGALRDYRQLSPERAIERIKILVDAVRRHRGVFVLLWHNSALDPLAWTGWAWVYEQALDHLVSLGANIDTIAGVLRDWVEFEAA